MDNMILVTGGSGLLGSKLKELLPSAMFPDSRDFDVTDLSQMSSWLDTTTRIATLVHCAAFTSPPRIDQDPGKGIDVNIVGTANIVKLCKTNDIRLVYISTDYVFDGAKGLYAETDPVLPANKYTWSKLGGECAVRMYDNSVIIRLTFGPDEFPYDAAFVDQWTSRESVSQIAPKVLRVIHSDITGIIHLGGKRKTVYEYATELHPHKVFKKLKRNEVSFLVPEDTSLNTNKYESLFEEND